MPQVPRFTDEIQTRRVDVGRVGADAPIEYFGGGRALDNTINAAIDFAQVIKNDADKIAIQEADRKLTEHETQVLSEALNKKGEESFQTPDTVKKSLQEKISEIDKGLFGRAQKDAFSRISQERILSANRRLTDHVARETQVYDDNKTSAFVDTQRQAAISFYNDPEAVGSSVKSQEDALREFGKRNGLPPEAIEQSVLKAKSQTHFGVISRMLDSDDDISAESYYKSNKDNILGDYQAKIEHQLQIGSTIGKAQRFVDTAVKSGMNLSQALKEAAKEENPKVRQAKEERASHVFGQLERAKRQEQDIAFDKLAMQTMKSGELPKLSQLGNLRPEQVSAITKYRDANDLRDDSKAYNDLLELAMNPKTRDSFASEDLSSPKYYNNLNLHNWQKLRQLQIEVIGGKSQGKGIANAELDGMYSDSQIADSVYQSAFKASFKKKDEDYKNFKLIMDQQAAEYKRAHKVKSVPNEVMQGFANDALKKQVIGKGMLWGEKETEFFKIANEISEEERQAYASVLLKLGKPVTPLNIAKYHLKYMEKKKAKN